MILRTIHGLFFGVVIGCLCAKANMSANEALIWLVPLCIINSILLAMLANKA